jgi:hypothetical protein
LNDAEVAAKILNDFVIANDQQPVCGSKNVAVGGVVATWQHAMQNAIAR